MCMHLCLLLCLCLCAGIVWVRVCVYLDSVYECVWAFCCPCQYMCVYAPSIFYEVRAWVVAWGWIVSFGIDLFYYVCARHATHLLHTAEKQPLSGCCLAQCLKTSQIMQDTVKCEQELCCLTFFKFFFFTSLWTFAPTTLKSILYLLSYKSFLWTQKASFASVCVGFQMLEHFAIIDFQPHSKLLSWMQKG